MNDTSSLGAPAPVLLPVGIHTPQRNAGATMIPPHSSRIPRPRLLRRPFGMEEEMIMEPDNSIPPTGGTLPPAPPPIPEIPSVLESPVPLPENAYMEPSAEVAISESEIPPSEAPYNPNVDDFLPDEVLPFGESPEVVVDRLSQTEYLESARNQLTTPLPLDPNSRTIGFLDKYGYVVQIGEAATPNAHGSPTNEGEATYYTAVAIIALSSSNYNPDGWDVENANTKILAHLDVLLSRSWSDRDEEGRQHPIRHFGLMDYDQQKQPIRQRPLTRDSFGQILAACYYAYNCPHSSTEVKTASQTLLQKWIEYLEEHNFKLHSKFIENEFEAEDGKLVNIFDADGKRVKKLSETDFVLLPHELYSFKNCAKSLGLFTIVVPWLDGYLADYSALGPGITRAVGDTVREVMLKILDNFHARFSGWTQLIPRWSRSKIKISVDLALPEGTKRDIAHAFQWFVQQACANMLQTPNSSPPGVIRQEDLAKIAEMFPPAWLGFPIVNVLSDLLDQALPWANPESLLEFYTFAAMTLFNLSNRSSSYAGYSFWSFLVEMECRPSLAPLLRPFLQQYFNAIKPNNENGLWAWLLLHHNVVNSHLSLFESKPLNNWSEYAYDSTNYNAWKTDKENPRPDILGPASSRLDYLVLYGLREKGAPQAELIHLSWAAFRKGVQEALEYNIKDMIDRLRNVGKLERTIFEVSGRAMEEVVDLAGKLERTIWKDGKLFSKLEDNMNGVVKQFRWTPSLTLSDSITWDNVPLDGVLEPKYLAELQLRQIDGTLRKWQWDAAGSLKSFDKWVGSDAFGGASGINQVLRLTRDVGGELTQTIFNQNVVLYTTKWAMSTEKGLARLQDCTRLSVRAVDGQLKQWAFNPEHNLVSFVHWSTSTPFGAAEVTHVLTNAWHNGQTFQALVYNDAGVFQSFTRWLVSSPLGLTDPKDCILHQLRSANAVLEEWGIDQSVVRTYGRWVNAAPRDGSAAAKDMVQRVAHEGERFISNTWKDGISIGTKILDGAGNVLSVIGDVGGAIGDAIEAIGHVFHGWH